MMISLPPRCVCMKVEYDHVDGKRHEKPMLLVRGPLQEYQYRPARPWKAPVGTTGFDAAAMGGLI